MAIKFLFEKQLEKSDAAESIGGSKTIYQFPTETLPIKDCSDFTLKMHVEQAAIEGVF